MPKFKKMYISASVKHLGSYVVGLVSSIKSVFIYGKPKMELDTFELVDFEIIVERKTLLHSGNGNNGVYTIPNYIEKISRNALLGLDELETVIVLERLNKIKKV